MQPSRPVELGPESADDRGAAPAAPRSTPLELVGPAAEEPRGQAWLEATATAAAVAVLMREARDVGLDGSRRALLQALRAGPPADVAAFVSRGRRLGFELSAGAVALCARQPSGTS